MAKKKISLLGIVLLAVAAVGLILAIVGIAIDFFKFSGNFGGVGDSGTLKLFFENSSKDKSKLPVSAVQAFAVLAVIFAAGSAAVTALSAFGVVKLNFLVKVIVCALTVVMAILVFALGLAYAGQATSSSLGGIASSKGTLAAGGWLLPIGTIMCAVPALLAK